MPQYQVDSERIQASSVYADAESQAARLFSAG